MMTELSNICVASSVLNTIQQYKYNNTIVKLDLECINIHPVANEDKKLIIYTQFKQV